MSKLHRYIVYGLRHNPKDLGVTLDAEGWCRVDDLLAALGLTADELDQAIAESGERLCLSDDGSRIRAAHGHSVHVDMDMSDEPPALLYHGTSTDAARRIAEEGISAMSRAYVHLSETTAAAARVGRRHSSSVAILTIDAARMAIDGYGFHKSEDGVWLTETVPPEYVKGWRRWQQ